MSCPDILLTVLVDALPTLELGEKLLGMASDLDGSLCTHMLCNAQLTRAYPMNIGTRQGPLVLSDMLA
jgi:hypothetical protein